MLYSMFWLSIHTIVSAVKVASSWLNLVAFIGTCCHVLFIILKLSEEVYLFQYKGQLIQTTNTVVNVIPSQSWNEIPLLT